jgi:hypothetical protein
VRLLKTGDTTHLPPRAHPKLAPTTWLVKFSVSNAVIGASHIRPRKRESLFIKGLRWEETGIVVWFLESAINATDSLGVCFSMIVSPRSCKVTGVSRDI